MKTTLNTLKSPSSLRSIRFTSILFIIVGLVSYAASYAVAHVKYSDSIANEITSGTTQLSPAANEYLLYISVVGLVLLILSIASLVVAYRYTLKTLKHESYNPLQRANTTATIVTVLAFVVSFFYDALSLTLPSVNVEEYTKLTPANIAANAFVYALYVALFFIVRYFAHKRALRENEELFS